VQPERLPTTAELGDYYHTYSYDLPASWEVDPATESSPQALERRLRRYRVCGRLLDVGCGAGAVLRTMSNLGWRVEGQEVSAVAADRLEELGFLVHRGAVESLDLPAESFDVVVMSEVVEHLLAPQVTLAAVHRLLCAGGALYLTTPNFGSLSRNLLHDKWRAIDIPGHVSYFEHASLRSFLGRAGFRRVRVWSEGLNPYEIVACLRGSGPAAAGAVQVRSQTEHLRNAAARPGIALQAKRLVNAALRAARLGDTLKALAEK